MSRAHTLNYLLKKDFTTPSTTASSLSARNKRRILPIFTVRSTNVRRHRSKEQTARFLRVLLKRKASHFTFFIWGGTFATSILTAKRQTAHFLRVLLKRKASHFTFFHSGRYFRNKHPHCKKANCSLLACAIKEESTAFYPFSRLGVPSTPPFKRAGIYGIYTYNAYFHIWQQVFIKSLTFFSICDIINDRCLSIENISGHNADDIKHAYGNTCCC